MIYFYNGEVRGRVMDLTFEIEKIGDLKQIVKISDKGSMHEFKEVLTVDSIVRYLNATVHVQKRNIQIIDEFKEAVKKINDALPSELA